MTKDPMLRAERATAERRARQAEKVKAKRAARKARKASVAVSAAIWDDREGKARPTAERRAKGAFVLRDGEDAGVTVAVDTAATVLDQLAIAGQITEDQRQAGIDLAMVLHRTRLGSQGRSCIDFSPVGYADDDAQETHQQQRDRQQRMQVYAACNGPWVWPELYRVCGEDRPVRHLESLRAGLDLCIKVFGK